MAKPVLKVKLVFRPFALFFFVITGLFLHVLKVESTSTSSSHTSYTIIASPKEVIKSNYDKHEYQYMSLANGMHVLLISDPIAKKSMAALSVNVGSASEPQEIPGLAHLTERALIMGTEKYPNPGKRVKYFLENEGYFNGISHVSQTFFYFYIKHKAFPEGLNRLAQMLLAPHFDPESIEHEIWNIDQQNNAMKMSNFYMSQYFLQLLCQPTHPYCRFNIGNYKTLKQIPQLKGMNTTEEVKTFYNRYYSSNHMKLVLVSNQTIPALETMAEDLFSPIENKKTNPLEFLKRPWDGYIPGQMKQFIRAKGHDDFSVLNLRWVLRYPQEFRKSRPFHYLALVFEHKGNGSLFQALNNQGLATEFFIDFKEDYEDFIVLDVQIKLTHKGAERMERVILLFFQFITLLKRTSLEQHKIYFNLFKYTHDYAFQYPHYPIADVLKLASDLQQNYPPTNILYARRPINIWNSRIFSRALNALDANFQTVLVLSRNYTDEKLNETDPIYGMQYTQGAIPTSLFRKIIFEDYDIYSNLSFPKVVFKYSNDI